MRSLEVQRDGAWAPLPRMDTNFFVEASGLGPGPYTFRVTGTDGQQLVEPSVPLADAREVAGTQQFR